MISDWIQVRIDLTRDPKVARMLDLLRKSIGSYVLKISPDDLLSGVTSRVTCPVTDLVTGHALRDVIVSALIRVWGTANTFIRDETIIGITLEWIDDVSQIPGFGKAMQKVGWIESTPEDGIRFPNFGEWNRPKTNALRSSSAVRKERQRLRKWLAENPGDTPDRHAKMSRLNDIESRLPERDMSRDKSRDCPVPVTLQRKGKEQYSEGLENSAGTPDRHELALQADAIAAIYPRQDDPLLVRQTILEELQRGTDPVTVREAVQKCAGFIRKAPGGSSNQYVPKARTFFTEAQWRSPEAFESRWTPAQAQEGKHRNGPREISTIHTASKLPSL